MAKKSKSKELFAHRQLATQRVLRAIRVERGLKQTEVCDRIGRARTYVTIIEIGQRACSVPEFFELVEAMGADPLEALTRIAHWKGDPEDSVGKSSRVRGSTK